MDRRRFLKLTAGGAAALAVPGLVVPKRKVWALDQTMIAQHPLMRTAPARGFDDAPFLQWHVDHGVPVPPGYYEISKTVVIPKHGALVMDNSHLVYARDIDAIRFDRPPDVRDRIVGNVLIPEGWDRIEPFPFANPATPVGTVRMGPITFPAK